MVASGAFTECNGKMSRSKPLHRLERFSSGIILADVNKVTQSY